ncbi:MAG: 4Fe-4S binding protein [Patescibacteria group bacterium]|nr:4Fe-4S binding protein [Patescibacteria group bacterium]
MSIDITVQPGSTTINKTGGWRTFRPSTDLEHCISCGTCARVCPENCIKMTAPLLPKEGLGVVPKPKPQTDYDFCKGCGVCASECPVKVIKMELERK